MPGGIPADSALAGAHTARQMTGQPPDRQQPACWLYLHGTAAPGGRCPGRLVWYLQNQALLGVRVSAPWPCWASPCLASHARRLLRGMHQCCTGPTACHRAEYSPKAHCCLQTQAGPLSEPLAAGTGALLQEIFWLPAGTEGGCWLLPTCAQTMGWAISAYLTSWAPGLLVSAGLGKPGLR